MFRRLNEALPELMLGILIYGIVVQLAGVWFVGDKLHFSSGLWIGILTAMGMAYHIARVIAESIDALDPERVKTSVAAKGILRYVMVVVIFFVMMYFDLGNLAAAFIGVLGLKISAYFQPALHKVILKVTGKGETSSDEKSLKKGG